MPRTSDHDIVFSFLEDRGGAARRSTILNELGWESGKLDRALTRLVTNAKVTIVQGGTVKISSNITYGNERSLYTPLKESIQRYYGPDWNVQELYIEVTAATGGKTMGRWSKPDLCAISQKTFKFIRPKQIDLWTFEVKPLGQMSVEHVLEAVAHSRFAHRSYVMFHIRNESIITTDRFLQCFEEANRHGVGLVTFTDPRKYSQWRWHSECLRRIPNPENLDRFITEQLSSTLQGRLLNWLA